MWVRLSGKLYENTVNTFNEEVLPVILKHGIMYIVVNLDKLNVIDIKGIEALMNLNDLVSFSNGKIILCSLTSNEVKEN